MLAAPNFDLASLVHAIIHFNELRWSVTDDESSFNLGNTEQREDLPLVIFPHRRHGTSCCFSSCRVVDHLVFWTGHATWSTLPCVVRLSEISSSDGQLRFFGPSIRRVSATWITDVPVCVRLAIASEQCTVPSQ